MRDITVRLKSGEEESFVGEVVIDPKSGYNSAWAGIEARLLIFETQDKGIQVWNMDSVESILMGAPHPTQIEVKDGPDGPAPR